MPGRLFLIFRVSILLAAFSIAAGVVAGIAERLNLGGFVRFSAVIISKDIDGNSLGVFDGICS